MGTCKNGCQIDVLPRAFNELKVLAELWLYLTQLSLIGQFHGFCTRQEEL